MAINSKIVPRHKVLAFYHVSSEVDTEKYVRMQKFTQLSESKNPIEYSRQYVDQPFQDTDVVSYSPSISYAFDRHTNLPVQQDIIDITRADLQFYG